MCDTPEAIKGVPVKILIKFKLFIAGKKMHDKKTWVSVGDETNIQVLYGLTSFEDFQQKVAAACKTGPIILKSMASHNPTMEWLATIVRAPNFLKKDKYQLMSWSHYKLWLETAVNTNKAKTGKAGRLGSMTVRLLAERQMG
ncbi:uncharacterized protein VP01_795g5 [Puccinia sorghi]|uniref:Uncharacterized protein n=1 Tax=Puccinia sorghi TaxID=27349 RepID=A0A0L6UAP0_9BASI|nr:uncharacterized protein VP01_795g5 [Puccinia sorghi]